MALMWGKAVLDQNLVSMEAVDQWVLWKSEKGRKMPYQPNGQKASTTAEYTWSGFEYIKSIYKDSPEHFDGIGFVFAKDDGFCGIDIDDCIDEDG